jgi:GNAT superfamily N-acetyltransferase
VDDQPVWSVTCFFVSRRSRRKGVAVELLKAAVEHVKKQGGKIVEGYPVDAQKDLPAPSIYTGTTSAFRQAGFKEVAGPAQRATRPIFRFVID